MVSAKISKINKGSGMYNVQWSQVAEDSRNTRCYISRKKMICKQLAITYMHFRQWYVLYRNEVLLKVRQ